MLEKTKGVLPVWLAPVQVKVMPIADKHLDYAKEIVQTLRNKNIRVELDDRNEKIGYKIREAQLQKVPYMLVLGDKEVQNNEVGVRTRQDGDIGAMKTEEFIERIQKEVEDFAM